MRAFVTTFLLIAAAEMGDKTQLLTLALAARFPLLAVLGERRRGRREPQAPATRRSGPPQSARYDPRPLGSEIWSVLSRSSGRPRNCIPDNVPTGLAPKASEKLGSNTFLVVRLPFARPALVKYGRGSIASPLHHRPLLGRTITWKCRCGSRR